MIPKMIAKGCEIDSSLGRKSFENDAKLSCMHVFHGMGICALHEVLNLRLDVQRVPDRGLMCVGTLRARVSVL